MGINASQLRRASWKHAIFFGVALQALPLTACSGASDSDVAQSTDPLKGGIPAAGKTKAKTNGNHMGQAGAPSGHGHDDAGVNDDKGNNGHGQGAAGSVGGQGQGQDKDKGGRPEAGSSGSETHGKSGQAHSGSHAQGPKAGHGAQDGEDMNDEADETP